LLNTESFSEVTVNLWPQNLSHATTYIFYFPLRLKENYQNVLLMHRILIDGVNCTKIENVSLACCEEKIITFSQIIENDINPHKHYS